MRREDLAAETCSFSRSDPYRPDGAGGALLGALAGSRGSAPAAASGKETSRLRGGESGLASAFPAAAAFLIRAAHRSVLIAFDLTAGVGVSRGFLSGPEGFGGALLEEPSFLGLPRGFGVATSWSKSPPPASFRSAAAFSSALAGFRRMCPASMSSAVGCLRGLPRLRGGSPGSLRLFRGVGSFGS